MGAAMGYFGSALGGQSVTNWAVNAIYNNSQHSGFDSFEKFHFQVIEWFRKINEIMPGKHFEIPSDADLQKCYRDWERAGTNEGKKKQAIKDLLEKIHPKTADLKTTLVTGLVVPPTAMICKKSAENIPALGKIRLIPDFVFVPSATFVCLAGVRLLKKPPQMKSPDEIPLHQTASKEKDKQDQNSATAPTPSKVTGSDTAPAPTPSKVTGSDTTPAPTPSKVTASDTTPAPTPSKVTDSDTAPTQKG